MFDYSNISVQVPPVLRHHHHLMIRIPQFRDNAALATYLAHAAHVPPQNALGTHAPVFYFFYTFYMLARKIPKAIGILRFLEHSSAYVDFFYLFSISFYLFYNDETTCGEWPAAVNQTTDAKSPCKTCEMASSRHEPGWAKACVPERGKVDFAIPYLREYLRTQHR